MDPILNSPMREGIRSNCERAMKNELDYAETERMSYLTSCGTPTKWAMIAGVGSAFLLVNVIGVAAFAIALVICVTAVIVEQVRKAKIRKLSRERIANIRSDWEQKTVQQIEAYNNQVKQYSQKALKNSASIQPMADHVTDMFKRMISHANSASNVKYIETDFTYEVKKSEIVFYYDSDYSNPRSSYNFDTNRYRNLNSDVECEGLARALSVMTTRSVIASYPPHYVVGDKIPLDHIDARVTLHFKAVNKNFQTAKDIF